MFPGFSQAVVSTRYSYEDAPSSCHEALRVRQKGPRAENWYLKKAERYRKQAHKQTPTKRGTTTAQPIGIAAITSTEQAPVAVSGCGYCSRPPKIRLNYSQRMAREWPKNGQRYRESLLSSPQVPEPAQRHREAMTRHAAHGAPFPFLLWHSRCQDTSADGCAHCTAMDGNTRCTQLQHQPSEGQIYM